MKYAPPTLEVARAQIGILVSAYAKATGLPVTFISTLITAGPEGGGNAAFLSRIRESDFRHEIFDRINSRLSALWPADAKWPAGIPRQAPADIDLGTRSSIAARLQAMNPKAKKPARAGWPADLPWPADIPLPGDDAGTTTAT